MPEVVAAYQKFNSKGFRIIGVSLDEAGKKDAVQEAVKRLGVTWPTIYDGKGGEGPLAQLNRVTGIPESFLLDHRGRVRYTGLSGDELQKRIAELLKEKSEGRD